MNRALLKIILPIVLLSYAELGLSERIIIEWGYNDASYEAIGLATSAVAYLEGRKGDVLGKARFVTFKSNDYVEVEETHYSPSGAII